jgi:hypothetical protein
MENASLLAVIWIPTQLEMHQTGLFPSSLKRTTGMERLSSLSGDEETMGTLGSGCLLDNASAV